MRSGGGVVVEDFSLLAADGELVLAMLLIGWRSADDLLLICRSAQREGWIGVRERG
jgi:hypothetical protein